MINRVTVRKKNSFYLHFALNKVSEQRFSAVAHRYIQHTLLSFAPCAFVRIRLAGESMVVLQAQAKPVFVVMRKLSETAER